jgi:hypothetical protein
MDTNTSHNGSKTERSPMAGPTQAWVIRGILLATLLISAALMFARLGHYALWDDEASTALHAKGVLATGDTSAVIGHNVYAYRGGIVLRNLCDRVTPPLSSYLAAAVMPLLGDGAGAVRFPFALFGFATVVLILWWLHKANAPWITWALYSVAIIGNVSLFLYSRQCRYYGPSIFASTALVYLYLHWKGTVRHRFLFVLTSLLLLAANYLVVIVLYGCLLVDFLLFERQRISLSWKDLCWLLIPQIIIGGLIVSVWNPLMTDFGGTREHNSLLEKLSLFWWNIRDMNACEFYTGFLLLLVPLLYFTYRDKWLLRGFLCLLVYVAAMTALTPQDVHNTTVADIRYCVPMIPLGIFLGVRVLSLLGRSSPSLALLLACAAFFTNFLHGGLFSSNGLRSTIYSYVQELLDPPSDPYTPTAAWINSHLQDGQSILVEPEYMMCPLMYHAPKAVYAWQLEDPPKPQFAHLPPIHFRYRIAPDYIIAFGPALAQVQQLMTAWNHPEVKYTLVETLDQLGKDLYRPELFWRSFTPITNFDRNVWGIHIFKRTVPPVESARDAKGN